MNKLTFLDYQRRRNMMSSESFIDLWDIIEKNNLEVNLEIVHMENTPTKYNLLKEIINNQQERI